MSSQGDDRNITSAPVRHVAEKRPLTSVRTRQEHIAHIAKKYTDSPTTTLSYHMDMLWMREAFSRLKKDSATGIDGVTVQAYATDLESNLADLLEQAKSGRYRPPPGKRVQIPKNEKETRPISISTTENKVLERAVTMLLEPIYETEFLDCSYGFRPKRSAHQALDILREKLMGMDGGWVLDVDLRKFFEEIIKPRLKGDAHLIRFADDFVLGENEKRRIFHKDENVVEEDAQKPERDAPMV